MAEDTDTSPMPNGADTSAPEAPPPSLREVAEQSWNDIETGVESESAGEQRLRDNLGRFIGKDDAAGEQPGERPDPALQQDAKARVAEPSPAAPQGATSSEAPAHWSAEDRATFSKLPPEAQAFLSRRHTDMERDYQQKMQANATAVQFAATVAPVFQDPTIARSMIATDGSPIHPAWAIKEWANMHVRAMNPDPNIRAALLVDLAQRMQLNPAAVFGQNRQGGQAPEFTEAELADPAIRYLADHLGQALNGVQSLRGELQAIQARDHARQTNESVRATRYGIDQYADEKDASGRPLRPHFDAVLPQIMELYKANPDRDLNEAYETAVWMSPHIRQQLVASERNGPAQQLANERAAQAARSNIRGRTSPVSKPDQQNAPKGLRATIAAAADEVGM